MSPLPQNPLYYTFKRKYGYYPDNWRVGGWTRKETDIMAFPSYQEAKDAAPPGAVVEGVLVRYHVLPRDLFDHEK